MTNQPRWPDERQPWPGQGRQSPWQYQQPPWPNEGQQQYSQQPLPVPYVPPQPGYPSPAPYQGQPPAQRYWQVKPRNPGLGAIVSFFAPGLGSMINGKVGKGIAIMGCYLVACVTCLILIGFVLVPAVWIWAVVAGYGDAQKWNREHGILS